jgi:hypothetical protein
MKHWERPGPSVGRRASPYRDPEALLRTDQAVIIILLQIDLDAVDLAAELVVCWTIVRRDRRAGLLPDVAGLIGGEHQR